MSARNSEFASWSSISGSIWNAFWAPTFDGTHLFSSLSVCYRCGFQDVFSNLFMISACVCACVFVLCVCAFVLHASSVFSLLSVFVFALCFLCLCARVFLFVCFPYVCWVCSVCVLCI